jgi:hypothetical protein
LQTKESIMRILVMGTCAAMLLAGCADGGRYGRPDPRWQQYDHDRYDQSAGGYYADQYYRDDRRYRERRLQENDRVYRGRDGRFYCRRSDGTTGLIVGGITGGVLGNVIAPGGSQTLGTILGALAGAAVGSAIDRDNVRCR